MSVAAINADGQPAIQPRQGIPIAPSALNEEQLLITELILKPLGHLLRMTIDRGLVCLEWQYLLQHVNGYAKGQKSRPLRFQVASLWW